MTRVKITFTNNIHGSEASSYANNGILNARQVKSLIKRLCGIDECVCGGIYESSCTHLWVPLQNGRIKILS